MAAPSTADRMLAACDLFIEAGTHLDTAGVAAAGSEQLARLARCELAVVAFEGPDGISSASYPHALPANVAETLIRDGNTVSGRSSWLFSPDNRVASIRHGGTYRGAIAAVGPVDGDFTVIEEWLVLVVARRLEAQLELIDLHRQSLRDAQIVHDAVLAGEMQQALLSKPTLRTGGVEMTASLRPARHVGGDLYEVAEADGYPIGLVADVSGKGAPAAMLTTAVHAAARHAIAAAGPDPVDILCRLGTEIAPLLDRTESIVTIAAAVVDPAARSVTVASAGHSPVLVRRFGRVSPVEPSAPPPGVPNFDTGLRPTTFTLWPGDLVLIGSDGLTDQRSPHGGAFGTDRLHVSVEGLEAGPAEQNVASLFGVVDRFRAGAAQDDDQTALMIVIGEDDR